MEFDAYVLEFREKSLSFLLLLADSESFIWIDKIADSIILVTEMNIQGSLFSLVKKAVSEINGNILAIVIP